MFWLRHHNFLFWLPMVIKVFHTKPENALQGYFQIFGASLISTYLFIIYLFFLSVWIYIFAPYFSNAKNTSYNVKGHSLSWRQNQHCSNVVLGGKRRRRKKKNNTYFGLVVWFHLFLNWKTNHLATQKCQTFLWA